MDPAISTQREHASNWAFLPIGLFGSVMGLTGLSIAWQLAHARYGAPSWIADIIGATALLALAALLLGYLIKAIRASALVAAEFRHPVAGNLFGTLFISLLLAPILIAPYALLAAQLVWTLGAISMVAFATVIVSRWLTNRQTPAHATPAWFIPVVGMLDLPLALPSLEMPMMHSVKVLGLAVGLFFAIPIFTLVFARLLFEEPLPRPLEPSLLIMVAPFAVGFSTYLTISAEVDLFAETLYLLTLFFLVILVGRLRNAAFCCPFKVSWWAISFPLAASAITAIRFAMAQPNAITDAIALILLAFSSLSIAYLLVRTVWGIARGELETLTA